VHPTIFCDFFQKTIFCEQCKKNDILRTAVLPGSGAAVTTREAVNCPAALRRPPSTPAAAQAIATPRPSSSLPSPLIAQPRAGGSNDLHPKGNKNKYFYISLSLTRGVYSVSHGDIGGI